MKTVKRKSEVKRMSDAEAAKAVKGSLDPLVRRVWFTMVLHPAKGWMRAGKAYGSREAAAEWVPFVRGAWRGLRTKVSQCTLRFVNGQLDERSRRTLDEKFNMDSTIIDLSVNDDMRHEEEQ